MTGDLLSFPTPPERKPPRLPTSPEALEWRARIAALPEDKDPCPGYRHGEWARVRARILETLDRWGDELVRLGWTTEELLHVHDRMGIVRADGCGALVSTPRTATGVEPRAVMYGHLRSYRGKPGQTYGVPIWAFVWPKAAPKKLEGWR